MRGETIAPRAARVIDDDIERTRCGHAGIKLLKRAGACIARIGEFLEPGRRLAGVELDEALARHVGLATDFQGLRGVGRQGLWNGRDRGRVCGDVVPDDAVATGRRLHEASVLIAERQRNAVDLRFDNVSEARNRLADEGVEIGEFALGVGLVQGLHRRIVRDLGKALGDAAGDLADGRGFVLELGILVLESQELLLPEVIVAITDRRLREIVVIAVRLLDQLAQFVDARLDFLLAHRRELLL